MFTTRSFQQLDLKYFVFVNSVTSSYRVKRVSIRYIITKKKCEFPREKKCESEVVLNYILVSFVKHINLNSLIYFYSFTYLEAKEILWNTSPYSSDSTCNAQEYSSHLCQLTQNIMTARKRLPSPCGTNHVLKYSVQNEHFNNEDSQQLYHMNTFFGNK